MRGGQALSVYAERSGLSRQSRLPSDAEFFRLFDVRRSGRELASAESLLEHFRARQTSNFFAAFSDRAETVAQLRTRFGASAQTAVIERARKICAGRFDLLGLHDLSFGEPLDWHLEPVSGKRVSLKHWSRINYLDAEAAGDKKIIWELNRHQYFMTLGRAYWYTDDERYAQVFAAHLEAWMDANPPKQGINWASSLELSFRAISWLWAFHFFKDSKHLSPA
ncbi:MAG TPA: heparinase II/III family protein, partial [Pyrinomonadaceae bacterium]|nr:heparinase II/III family protein [Pyrinomonadaceae bacterium]